MTDELQSRKNQQIIHMWWTIAVLAVISVAFCVFVFINKVLCGKTIYDFVTFFSSLLSIILSIFAILYSYISTVETSRYWSNTTNDMKTITEATKNINDSTKQLLNQVMSVYGEIKSLKELNGTNKYNGNVLDPKINNYRIVRVRNVKNKTE